MKHFLSICVLLVGIASVKQLNAWGFWAHQRINRLAVFTLPPEMLAFYKYHIEYLTDHAVDPDKRRYAIDGEAARHYIDLDHYGSYPFTELPRRWDSAVSQHGEDSLLIYGNLPYHLPFDLIKLSKAFESRDLDQILKLSADIGHYVGDAHVPLHTTENYNGQLTGQIGIHGFWESRLPELFAGGYDFFVGRAFFIEDVLLEGWQAVLESHMALDSVLGFERELQQTFPPDKRYSYENRNNIVLRVYSREYARAYHRLLGGMVERRMRMAIRRVGSYWYTAWLMAGSPDLSGLLKQSPMPGPLRLDRLLKIIDREKQDLGMMPASSPETFSLPFRKLCYGIKPVRFDLTKLETG